MLVVVASRHDQSARAFVARWGPQRATILTCEDLSTAGWRHYQNDLGASRAVASGQVVPVNRITGVLTRRPSVLEQELLHIAPEDRSYVSAEMNAFLLSWLWSLPCPVLNPPTATSLSGPNWRPEQWVRAVARLDIPVQPRRRRAARAPESVADEPVVEGERVTVVGDRWFGKVAHPLGQQAINLARAAGVQLLGVTFDGRSAEAAFLSATLWPSIADDDVAEAIWGVIHPGRSRGTTIAGWP
jgi:hypothetical protein